MERASMALRVVLALLILTVAVGVVRGCRAQRANGRSVQFMSTADCIGYYIAKNDSYPKSWTDLDSVATMPLDTERRVCDVNFALLNADLGPQLRKHAHMTLSRLSPQADVPLVITERRSLGRCDH